MNQGKWEVEAGRAPAVSRAEEGRRKRCDIIVKMKAGPSLTTGAVSLMT